MIDFSSFYSIWDDESKDALIVDLKQRYFEDHAAVFRGTEKPSECPVFCRHMGHEPYDLIATGYAGLYLVSSRFSRVLEGNQVSGWSTYAAKVLDKDDQPIPGYSGLVIHGQCGPPQWEKGEPVMRKTFVGKMKKVYKGLYFDPKTYDGSDMFSLEGTTFWIVTSRVKQVLEQGKISNIRFESLVDFIRNW